LRKLILLALLSYSIQAQASPELLCLTKNVYYEARGECLKCRYAAARVVINRVEDNRWADNVCEVVYQRVQFSWTADVHRIVNDPVAWESSKGIALDVLENNAFSHFKALYFHNIEVFPDWASRTKFYKQKDNHIFYTDK
jgi:spore germination cell wall hydrolase CwlJ-like protein